MDYFIVFFWIFGGGFVLQNPCGDFAQNHAKVLHNLC